MKKVEFTLNCHSDEKIPSIKDIRSALPGTSLTKAKAMYEATPMGGGGWDGLCRVRVSMEAFGHLCAFISTDAHGRLGYMNVRIVEPGQDNIFDLTLPTA